MSDDTVRTLLELTEALSAASERSDADTLNRLIADDFVAVGEKSTGTKADVVARWGTPGDISDASHEINDAVVHDFGDTAIVVSNITDRWTSAEGVAHTYVERAFDVWQRRNGDWQLIAIRATKISSTP